MHKNKKPLFANSTSLSKSRPSCVVHTLGPDAGGIPILNAISNAAFRLFSVAIFRGSECPVNTMKAVRGGKASYMRDSLGLSSAAAAASFAGSVVISAPESTNSVTRASLCALLVIPVSCM